MPRTLLLAWASPAPGEDDAFHHWYDTVHIPQVTAVLSVVGPVQRFQLDPSEGAARFLAIYDLGDGADPQEAAGKLAAATENGQLSMVKAMDITGNPPHIQFVTSLS